MVVCYVTLQPSISQPPGKTVYALLLALDGKWDEVSVSKASVCDGYGVFPVELVALSTIARPKDQQTRAQAGQSGAGARTMAAISRAQLTASRLLALN